MDYQLVFTRKEKMKNLRLPENEIQKYIMDYLKLSSIHLKYLKCFLYREIAIDAVLMKEDFISILQFLLKYGTDSSCYYIDIGKFIQKETREVHEIECHFMDFIGVLYKNYK